MQGVIERIKLYEPLWSDWRVFRPIGSGRYGKVYEIRREDIGGVYKAAAKIMSVPLDNTDVREAFAEGPDTSEASVKVYYQKKIKDLMNEITIMNSLKGHSHIVSYEDHKIYEKTDGIGYDLIIRMELLTNLEEYYRTNTMSLYDVIDLGIHVCRALEKCQERGIIHRDIKPENIMVTADKNFKLGDFGVAKTLESHSAMKTQVGTKPYMAPEVITLTGNYDATVDIYSLGIVLYRLLNDNFSPFMSNENKANPEDAFMRRIKGEALPPAKNARGQINNIILKACAFSSSDRYQTPKQMKEELESARSRLKNNPVVLEPSPYSGDLTGAIPIGYIPVFFDPADGSEQIRQDVYRGSLVEPLQPKERPGFSFGGWFIDKDCSIPFDFTKPIERRTTIFSKWGTVRHKVCFSTGNKAEQMYINVDHGSLVTYPPTPKRKGYVLKNWTLDGNDFSFSQTITTDITLVAKWTRDIKWLRPLLLVSGVSLVIVSAIFLWILFGKGNNIVVTYDTQGGGNIPASEIKAGSSLVVPNNPSKDGHDFIGWYTDERFANEMDFTSAVSKSMTLYALWEKSKLKVTFISADGSVFDEAEVYYGDFVQRPSEFVVWLSDGREFDFNTEIHSNVTLEAFWIENSDGALHYKSIQNISDLTTLSKSIQDIANLLSDEQKKTPSILDEIALFAELAIAQYATVQIDNSNESSITWRTLQDVQGNAIAAKSEILKILDDADITILRTIRANARLSLNEYDSYNIKIDKSVCDDLSLHGFYVDFDDCSIYLPMSSLEMSMNTASVSEISIAISKVDSSGSQSNISGNTYNVSFTPSLKEKVSLLLPVTDGDVQQQAIIETAEEKIGISKYVPGLSMLSLPIRENGIYGVVTLENREFNDLTDSSAEAIEAILRVSSLRIMNGNEKDEFMPLNSTSREHIAIIVAKTISEYDANAVSPIQFPDVSIDNTNYSYIASVAKLGIMSGGTNNMFDPTRDILKADAFVVLSKALMTQMPSYNYTFSNIQADNILSDAFTDEGKIENYARDYIAFAIRVGLITDDELGGNFNPRQSIPREMMAVYIMRVYDRLWL